MNDDFDWVLPLIGISVLATAGMLLVAMWVDKRKRDRILDEASERWRSSRV